MGASEKAAAASYPVIVCTPECWTPVECPVHHWTLPPRGRSAPDGMPTCEHVYDPENRRHLWDQHDPERWRFNPDGEAEHLAQCARCRAEWGDDDA